MPNSPFHAHKNLAVYIILLFKNTQIILYHLTYFYIFARQILNYLWKIIQIKKLTQKHQNF